MQFNTLHELFINELKDIYDAENQIIEAMPMMVDAASAPKLKDMFQKHMEETRIQVESLEDVFDMLDVEPEREHCDGMEGILKDGEKMVSAQGDSNVKDAGLIAAAQKVEHYEISSYGTLRSWASTMGHDDVADILQKTMRQESFTDEQLTRVAERSVNAQAPQM